MQETISSIETMSLYSGQTDEDAAVASSLHPEMEQLQPQQQYQYQQHQQPIPMPMPMQVQEQFQMPQQPPATSSQLQLPQRTPAELQALSAEQLLHSGQLQLLETYYSLEDTFLSHQHDFKHLQELVVIQKPNRLRQLQHELDTVQQLLKEVRREHDLHKLLDGDQQDRQVVQLTACVDMLNHINAENQKLQLEQHQRLQGQQRQLELEHFQRQQQLAHDQQLELFRQQQQQFQQYQQAEIGHLMALIEQHQLPSDTTAAAQPQRLPDEQRQQQRPSAGNPLEMIGRLVQQLEQIQQRHAAEQQSAEQEQEPGTLLVSFKWLLFF